MFFTTILLFLSAVLIYWLVTANVKMNEEGSGQSTAITKQQFEEQMEPANFGEPIESFIDTVLENPRRFSITSKSSTSYLGDYREYTVLVLDRATGEVFKAEFIIERLCDLKQYKSKRSGIVRSFGGIHITNLSANILFLNSDEVDYIFSELSYGLRDYYKKRKKNVDNYKNRTKIKHKQRLIDVYTNKGE